MAEIAVFMHDREGKDINHTAKLAQRGDVLIATVDGHMWGIEELTNDMFRIVVVPDAVPEDFQSLLSHEFPLPGNEDAAYIDMTNTLQFRGFKLDVDSYTPGLTRGAKTTVVLDDVMALKVQKAPLPDPKIIGKSEKVIG
jgi:hypothetical protein